MEKRSHVSEKVQCRKKMTEWHHGAKRKSHQIKQTMKYKKSGTKVQKKKKRRKTKRKKRKKEKLTKKKKKEFENSSGS